MAMEKRIGTIEFRKKQMKTVLIYSGGLDSTVLLYWLRDCDVLIKALGVNYGQRHGKELDHARRLCQAVAVPFEVADLSGLRPLLGGSSQISDEVAVPDGHCVKESMKVTVVPNRNMIMLSVAIGHAVSLRYDEVAYAAHGGDHAVYPDCRPEFAAIIDAAAAICDWRSVRLARPFINKTKAELVILGNQLGVPFEETWSCYKGCEIHCGTCGACIGRKKAFAIAKIQDPAEYEIC